MKRIALFLMAAIAVIACDKTPEIVPEINVTSTETTLPVAGTEDMSFKVQFNANVDWTAALKEQVQWCTVTPPSGVAGDASVTVIAVENDTKEPRKVTLVLTAGTAVKEVELTQLQKNAIELVETAATVGAEGGEYALKVMTNVDYSVVVPEDVDWVTIASSKAYAEATTKLVVAPFEALDATRKAELTVKADGFEDMVFTLTQEGVSSVVWSIAMSSVMNNVATCTTSDGIPEIANNVSIALYDGNLVVCAGDGSAPVILDKTTGNKKSELTVEGYVPYYIKNDDAGNLVMCNRMWSSWAGYFGFRYIVPGSTVAMPITDYYMFYIGAGFSVRGDVTSKAIIGAPHENGGYGDNRVFVIDINAGTNTYVEAMPVTGFGGLASWGDGWQGCWCNAPNNFPGFAFMGNNRNDGAVMAVYGENKLYAVDTSADTAPATLLSESEVLDSNTAANAMDVRNIAGVPYIAITGGNFYASPSPIQVINAATKEVYTMKSVSNAEEFTTNSSAAIVIEEAEGGINIYHVNNSTNTIGKHFLSLK